MKKPRSVFLFRYCDALDVLFLVSGSIFACIHGAAMPVLGLVFGKMTDAFVVKTKEGSLNCNGNGTLEANGSHFANNYTTMSTIYSSTTMSPGCAPSDTFSVQMTTFALQYVYIGLGVFVTSILQVLCWEISCERQVFHIREKFFSQVLRQEISWFDTQQTGDLTTKLQDDVERVREGIGHKFSMVMQYLATFVAGFMVGFAKSWRLTLIILAITPVLAGTSAFTGRVMASASAREQEKYGVAGAVAEEVLACIRTVAAFGGQPREIRRYEKALEEGSKTAKGKYQVIGIGAGVVFAVMYATYALAFWYGSKLYIQNQLSVGDLFTVFFSVLMGAFSLGNAVPYVSSIGVAQGAAKTVFSVIDSVPSIDPYSPRGLQLEGVVGSVQFRNVAFNYPSRRDTKILRNFCLEAEPGQTVALVGPSGSGKSTVVNLLLRYYDTDRGDVLIDGRDIRTLNVASLRQHIGVVSQEPILFGCSISENIRYGRLDVTFDEMVQASRMANAHSFITTLPMGYDTLVGERGAQLSGGQKQRIAIARALVRNPRILLLDEATSALDAQSEGIVQAALNKARQGRTTIVIAHRLSTIKDADVICVVKDGEVVEQGTHNELMNLEGLYFELVQAQMGTMHQEELQEGMELVEENRKVSKMSGRRRSSRRASSVRRPSNFFRRSMSVTSLTDREALQIEEEFEEEEVEEPSVWRIIKMNAPEWPYLTFGSIGAAVSGASMPVFAFFYSEIFQTFTKTGADLQSAAVFWSSMFIVLAVASGISMWLRIIGLALSGERLTLRLRVMAFTNILRQSVGWFDDEIHAGGRITVRLARDAPIVKQAAGHRVGLLLSAVVTMASALAISFAYSWKLALVIVAGFPLLVVSGFVQLRMKRGGQKMDDEFMEEAGRIASESLQNVRTVQALVQEKTFFKNYMSNLEPAYEESKKQAYVYGGVFAFSEAIMLFLYAAAYKYGGYLVDIHDTDPVSVYRVFFAISFCAVAVGQSMGFLPDYMKAKMAAGLMFKLIEMDPEIDNFSSEGAKPEIRGKVTFQDVHFRYPMRPNIRILRGLTFTLEPGHSLALVGPSGCGKSTAIALLERFYDPKRGTVQVDDYDIRTLSLSHLRSQMGLVTQEPVLFDCSIRDNISYGEYEDVLEEDIIKAAKVANIHDFICGLPKGYDTMVGERGTQLSGGQKQRIAIARALLRDPKILLLDEATSALDTENEKIVQEALDQAMKGRTSIIIAHRLTTIQNANCIAVVDKGQIVEMGTHHDLVNKRGMYYRLTKRQQLTQN